MNQNGTNLIHYIHSRISQQNKQTSGHKKIERGRRNEVGRIRTYANVTAATKVGCRT